MNNTRLPDPDERTASVTDRFPFLAAVLARIPDSLRDRLQGRALSATAAALLAAAALFGLQKAVSSQSRVRELEQAVLAAATDSAAASRVKEEMDRLQTQRDAAAGRVVQIQRLDAVRYRWAHLLEEVAIAAPPQLWLTHLHSIDQADGEGFRIEGRTRGKQDLSAFLERLERSAFARNVRLVSTAQEKRPITEGAPAEELYHFQLEGSLETPSPEAIQTREYGAAPTAASTSHSSTIGS